MTYPRHAPLSGDWPGEPDGGSGAPYATGARLRRPEWAARWCGRAEIPTPMTKRMLIDATHPEETRVVVLDEIT